MLIDSNLIMRIDTGRDLPYSVEDLKKTFTKVYKIRYKQQIDVETPPPEPGMCNIECQISAYNSGSNLGGTIWRICLNGEDIIYAPKYSIRNELHLDGAYCFTNTTSKESFRLTHDMVFFRPTGLLTPFPSFKKTKKKLKNELLDTTLTVLRHLGNVLIPLDSPGRLIEVIIELGYHWQKKKGTV
jgi:Cft2 family RNA processing exonuclease